MAEGRTVEVTVPATSANLGPGFDCLGIAWQLYNNLEFDTECEGTVITGCDEIYRNTDNPAYISYDLAMKMAGMDTESDKAPCLFVFF
jgi:homoserine kinase